MSEKLHTHGKYPIFSHQAVNNSPKFNLVKSKWQLCIYIHTIYTVDCTLWNNTLETEIQVMLLKFFSLNIFMIFVNFQSDRVHIGQDLDYRTQELTFFLYLQSTFSTTNYFNPYTHATKISIVFPGKSW